MARESLNVVLEIAWQRNEKLECYWWLFYQSAILIFNWKCKMPSLIIAYSIYILINRGTLIDGLRLWVFKTL